MTTQSRPAVDLNGTTLDLLVLMSEGNPGAAKVLTELAKTEPRGLAAILHLDEMNMRGAQIWAGLKEYCDGDINKLINAAIDHDPKLVAFVNDHPGTGDDVASTERKMRK